MGEHQEGSLQVGVGQVESIEENHLSFQVHWIVARRRHIGNCCLRRNSEPGSSSDHSDRGEEGGLAWQGAKEGPRADAQVTLS